MTAKPKKSSSLAEFARSTYHFKRLCMVCQLPQVAEINAARRDIGSKIGPKVIRDWLIAEGVEQPPSIPTLQKHFSEKHHESKPS